MSDKRHRKGVIKRQTAVNAESLREVLITARSRTKAVIDRSIAKGNFLTSKRVRDGLYAALGAEYLRFQEETNLWATAATLDVAKKWFGFAREDTGKKGISWGEFDSKYFENILARVHPLNATKLAAVNAQLGGMLQEDIRNIRNNVVETFRLQAASGMPRREAMNVLREKVEKQRPAWQFIDKSGKAWKADNYFDMLARTVTQNTARDTYMDSMAEDGLDLATIEGGITGSSGEYPSDPCDEWAGKIISITGATKGYPTLAEAQAAGVFHPRCIHYVAAVLPGELQEAKGYREEVVEQAEEAA